LADDDHIRANFIRSQAGSDVSLSTSGSVGVPGFVIDHAENDGEFAKANFLKAKNAGEIDAPSADFFMPVRWVKTHLTFGISLSFSFVLLDLWDHAPDLYPNKRTVHARSQPKRRILLPNAPLAPVKNLGIADPHTGRSYTNLTRWSGSLAMLIWL